MVDLLIILVGLPLAWQVPRLIWPVRLNSTATAFTGLYRRYSIETATGYASRVQNWTGQHLSTGGVSAQTTGMVIGSTVSASTTVSDTRRTFVTKHTGFFLDDQRGTVEEVDAANVGPSLTDGHLVSVAWLVHNGKRGNAFVVYNHTTRSGWVETTRTGERAAKRGLVRMVLTIPLVLQILLFLAIVTIPVMIVIALAAQSQVGWFRKRAVRPLIAVMEREAAEMPSRAGANASQRTAAIQADPDLAAQIKAITALHESGSLTADEFQAAKAKLLEKT